MSSSDDTERQPSMLPRLPSPCELPPGALPHHSPSHSGRARVLSLTPKMSNQSSRRNLLKSQLFSPSFDIDVNADLIQRSLSNDTANSNVEIQRILAENSGKSTSPSHIKSSAVTCGTSSNSLRCQKDEMKATTDALEGTDSSVSPVQFQQALSLQEDQGSLALIAAAAAAAISATAGSSPGTVVATDDEQRQKRDTIGVAASLGQGGDRDEPCILENNDDASRESSHTAPQWYHYAPQPLYHEQSGHFDHTGPLYNMNYPITEVPITQLSIPQSTGHQLPAVPTGAAYMYAASSCNNAFSPINETKRWRRRRPKKQTKASPKQHKKSFDRRPAKGPGSRGKRGGYRCRLCGEAKAKHDCSALEPYDASVQEDAESQTETVFADEKIALGSGIRVIAVRERRVSAAVLLGNKVKSEDTPFAAV